MTKHKFALKHNFINETKNKTVLEKSPKSHFILLVYIKQECNLKFFWEGSENLFVGNAPNIKYLRQFFAFLRHTFHQKAKPAKILFYIF